MDGVCVGVGLWESGIMALRAVNVPCISLSAPGYS